MKDPLFIITAPYQNICTNLGCDHRTTMTRKRMVRTALLTYIRMAFLMGCSAWVGASFTQLVHAQTVGERVAKIEVTTITLDGRVALLEKSQEHTASEVATLYGVGIGLGSALGLLQILQIILNRRSEA